MPMALRFVPAEIVNGALYAVDPDVGVEPSVV